MGDASKKSPQTLQRSTHASKERSTQQVAPSQDLAPTEQHQAQANPRHARPEAILALQRSAGNQAVQRLLATQGLLPPVAQRQVGRGTVSVARLQRKVIDDREDSLIKWYCQSPEEAIALIKLILGEKELPEHEIEKIIAWHKSKEEHDATTLAKTLKEGRKKITTNRPRSNSMEYTKKRGKAKQENAHPLPGEFFELAFNSLAKEEDQSLASAAGKKAIGLSTQFGTATEEQKKAAKKSLRDDVKKGADTGLHLAQKGADNVNDVNSKVGSGMKLLGEENPTSNIGTPIDMFTGTVGLYDNVSKTVGALKDLKDGAEGIDHTIAVKELKEGAQGTGTGMLGLIKNMLSLLSTAGVGEVSQAVPGLGAFLSAIELLKVGNEERKALTRLYTCYYLLEAIKEKSELASIVAVIENFMSSDAKRVAKQTVEVIANLASMAGSLANATGLGMIVGIPLAGFAALLKFLAGAGETLGGYKEAEEAYKGEKHFDPVKSIHHDPQLAVEGLLICARREYAIFKKAQERDAEAKLTREAYPALFALQHVFDLKPEKLDNPSNGELRGYILGELGQADKSPERLKEAYAEAKGKALVLAKKTHIKKTDSEITQAQKDYKEAKALLRGLFVWSGKDTKDKSPWKKFKSIVSIDEDPGDKVERRKAELLAWLMDRLESGEHDFHKRDEETVSLVIELLQPLGEKTATFGGEETIELGHAKFTNEISPYKSNKGVLSNSATKDTMKKSHQIRKNPNITNTNTTTTTTTTTKGKKKKDDK